MIVGTIPCVTPAAEPAKLIIYRPSATRASIRSSVVSLDGKAIATLTDCSYAKFDLQPGVHTVQFAFKPWPADREATRIPVSYSLDIAPGKMYFIGYHPGEMSNAELEETFINYVKRNYAHGGYLGLVHEKAAMDIIVDCKRIETVLN